MMEHDGFGLSIREMCYQDWLVQGGGVRAWHSLSPEESVEPDCNMLRIHMLRLSGLTCCWCARVFNIMPQVSVLGVDATNAFLFWCKNWSQFKH